MENKIKYLEMIQGIINRLANSSFLLKGWSILLVSALLSFAAQSTNLYFTYLALFPTVMIWLLDGYYLWQEKLYRKLYDKVRILEDSEIDFSMSTDTVKKKTNSWGRTVFTRTLNVFYGTVVAIILVVMGILIYFK